MPRTCISGINNTEVFIPILNSYTSETNEERDIEKLTGLRCLYLNDNNLKELPVSLFNLTKLEILDLTGNKSLKHLPFYLFKREVQVLLK
ncbi:MAG: hypothetical protein K940chlam6_00878 [Chlamydiae bacterium]|nr:hypothetical protein [Chlamydiota bacterium]